MLKIKGKFIGNEPKAGYERGKRYKLNIRINTKGNYELEVRSFLHSCVTYKNFTSLLLDWQFEGFFNAR